MTSDAPHRPTTSDGSVPANPPAVAADSEQPEVLEEFLEELPPAPTAKRRKRKLVLIGAGQTHLQILDAWRQRPIRGVELTLISAFPQAVYSGWLPAAVAGLVTADELSIDLASLAKRCRAELVIDKVVGLDPETRTLDLALYPEQNFDAVSINIGAANTREDLCQTHRVMVAVRPQATFLSRLEHRLQELLLQFREAPGAEYLQLAVVGAGALGVQLALCLEERAHREGWHAEVQLIDAREEILTGFAPRAIRLVRKLLKRRSIPVQLGSPVVDCDEDGPAELVLASGERIRVDLAIWACGSAPPGLLRGYPLPRTPAGFLEVRPTLQSTADLPVFAAGDIARLAETNVPLTGFGQASVLWVNLKRWFRSGTKLEYDPPVQPRSVLSCGDGTAIFCGRRWAVRSSWIWRWQQSRDRRFLRRFQ